MRFPELGNNSSYLKNCRKDQRSVYKGLALYLALGKHSVVLVENKDSLQTRKAESSKVKEHS